MEMLICVPVCGQYEIGRISLYCFDQLVSRDTDFLLIDNSPNGSPWPEWRERYKMDRWALASMKENTGLIRSCQYAYEYAKSQRYDILCLTHNDVWVYKENWDYVVDAMFQRIPNLGGVGLFGSKGCGKEGHRLDTFGSLIEMSGHGRKITNFFRTLHQMPRRSSMQWESATTFDGFFMCFSMQMLKAAGGFDQRYQMHHMYDLDASLTSIKLGYKNIVLNLPCHHLSGLTANNDAKSVCGPDVHAANSQLFLRKWGGDLGVMVDDNFQYRWSL